MTEKINSELLNYVREARRRGFDDAQIKRPLAEAGWQMKMINEAFASLNPKPIKPKKIRVDHSIKNQLTIYLSDEVINALNKRAKKNLLNLNEQIEDILRRSTINSKKNKQQEDKVDDLFLKLFSRKKCGRPNAARV